MAYTYFKFLLPTYKLLLPSSPPPPFQVYNVLECSTNSLFLADQFDIYFLFFFFTFIYFTSLREQDEAYINCSWWSMLVGLEPEYIGMWVTCSATVLWNESLVHPSHIDHLTYIYAIWYQSLIIVCRFPGQDQAACRSPRQHVSMIDFWMLCPWPSLYVYMLTLKALNVWKFT